MAVGTTYDYTDTAQNLIEDAMRSMGALGIGDSATSDEITYGLRVANRLMKSWHAKSFFNLWRYAEGTFAPIDETASYALSAPKPMRISEMRWRQTNGDDLNMLEMSRDDYFRLPDKTTTGTPTTFYYDTQRDVGTVFVWPVPDDVTTESFRYTYQRPFYDFDSQTNDADVPQEWYKALKLAIQADLYSTYFPADQQGSVQAEARAERAFQEAVDFDREPTSIRLRITETRW